MLENFECERVARKQERQNEYVLYRVLFRKTPEAGNVWNLPSDLDKMKVPPPRKEALKRPESIHDSTARPLPLSSPK